MNTKASIISMVMSIAIGASASPVQPNERSNVMVDHSDARSIYKNLPSSIGDIRAVGVLVEGKVIAYMSETEVCQLKTRWYPYPFDGNKFYVLRQGVDDLYRIEGCTAFDERQQQVSMITEYSTDASGYKREGEPRFTFIRVEWSEAPAYLERRKAKGSKKK